MITFLSGGTGTPKLLSGAAELAHPRDTTVIANTGDDVELGGLLVCPDVDTVLYERSGLLDRNTWWGIDDDSTETHRFLQDLADSIGIEAAPRYLDDTEQVAGRRIARWRRFSGAGAFMTIGDRDRAVHLLRTGLIDEGRRLTDVTSQLGDALAVQMTVLPMSDDPVATVVRTEVGPLHLQDFWVHRRGKPTVTGVEYRGVESATITDEVRRALSRPVVIGPANPVTSIGPLLAIDGMVDALATTTVIAVSPFVGDRVFSGPAPALMRGIGQEPSTAGVAAAYPFVDAFVLDNRDETSLDRPTIRTDTTISNVADSERVCRAIAEALEVVR